MCSFTFNANFAFSIALFASFNEQTVPSSEKKIKQFFTFKSFFVYGIFYAFDYSKSSFFLTWIKLGHRKSLLPNFRFNENKNRRKFANVMREIETFIKPTQQCIAEQKKIKGKKLQISYFYLCLFAISAWRIFVAILRVQTCFVYAWTGCFFHIWRGNLKGYK